jgi:hypothetical protein
MPPKLKKMCHQILVRAKDELAWDTKTNGDSEYLCFAIQRSSQIIPRSKKGESYLLNLIRERLESWPTYTGWLSRTYPELGNAVYWDYTDGYGKQAQLSRHAWLDSLIQEFA